ncbi:hypothetical protein LUR56_24620 [Streptomyces sp. MT29]|nr:hypothetical protein [Streptomyces sp. MT29]
MREFARAAQRAESGKLADDADLQVFKRQMDTAKSSPSLAQSEIEGLVKQ